MTNSVYFYSKLSAENLLSVLSRFNERKQYRQQSRDNRQGKGNLAWMVLELLAKASSPFSKIFRSIFSFPGEIKSADTSDL
jgi:hypothetical protein